MFEFIIVISTVPAPGATVTGGIKPLILKVYPKEFGYKVVIRPSRLNDKLELE